MNSAWCAMAASFPQASRATVITKNSLSCASMNGELPSPAERVIRRFGGQSALAGLLGKRQSTVEHWASTGRIPAQWHQPLMSLARGRGVILEAKDFVDSQPQDI